MAACPYPSRSRLVRSVCFVVALIVWLATAGGRLRRGRLVVLCYHGVTDAQRARFAQQMRAIAARAVDAGALGRPLKGRGRRDVLVTFDDAFENLLRNAVPALREHNVPAIVFAVSDVLGRTPPWDMPDDHPDRHEQIMSAEQLARLNQEAGVTIGSHTATHPRLTACGMQVLRDELSRSAAALAKLAGSDIDLLAAPYGAISAQVVRAASAAGYRYVFSLDPRLVTTDRDEVAMGRFSVSPDMGGWTFRLICDGAYGWLSSVRKARDAITLRAGLPGACASDPVLETKEAVTQ